MIPVYRDIVCYHMNYFMKISEQCSTGSHNVHNSDYPLVNVCISMERSTMLFMGKLTINRLDHFLIAMLNYQAGYDVHIIQDVAAIFSWGT